MDTSPHVNQTPGRGRRGDDEDLSSRPLDSKIFRSELGIMSTVDPKSGVTSIRPSTNEGIYKWTLDEERKAKWKYRLFTTVMDACLLLQVVVAAILVALGASSSPHIVITVFGAVNTAIAGLLALFKGQGLPNRLRQDLNGLRQVRESIVELDGVFQQPDCNLDVTQEVQSLKAMYHAARDTAEVNRPDVYVTANPGPRGPPTPSQLEAHAVPH